MRTVCLSHCFEYEPVYYVVLHDVHIMCILTKPPCRNENNHRLFTFYGEVCEQFECGLLMMLLTVQRKRNIFVQTKLDRFTL